MSSFRHLHNLLLLRAGGQRNARWKAHLISADKEGICLAAQRIKDNKLVAFPTETVFGLGANALDAEAVAKIYKAKQRPKTSPLIIHVHDIPSTEKLVFFNDPEERSLFVGLAEKFWPGPLTLVVKASPLIPSIVTAQTGFVGIRCPAHPIALSFLRQCNAPVAAPSANLYSRISPTRTAHVLFDFADKDVAVIDDGALEETCRHGIESTVIKLCGDKKEVIVLREGAVSKGDLIKCLLDIRASSWSLIPLPSPQCSKVGASREAGDLSPGLAVTHYAPRTHTFIVSNVQFDKNLVENAINPSVCCDITLQLPLKNLEAMVVVDYGGRLKTLKPHVLAYCDISSGNDPVEGAKNVYEALRWADSVNGACTILLADAEMNLYCTENMRFSEAYVHSITPALTDRMFRAASGVRNRILIMTNIA